MWTSSNQYAFMAIVAHHVTNEGQLGMLTICGLCYLLNVCPIIEELLIDFQELTGEHSGENIAEAV